MAVLILDYFICYWARQKCANNNLAWNFVRGGRYIYCVVTGHAWENDELNCCLPGTAE